MGTLKIDRLDFEEIVLNALNFYADQKMLAGNCVGEDDFYNVANEIFDNLIDIQEGRVENPFSRDSFDEDEVIDLFLDED